MVNINGLFINSEECDHDKSEESDGGINDIQGLTYFECDHDIKNLYFSSSMSNYSYLAIKSEIKVEIYEILEDENICCERKLMW